MDSAVKEVALEPRTEPATLPATVPALDPQTQMLRELAADPNFDVAKLQAMVEMIERAQDRAAEQQFNAAFARMQPRIPIIGEKAKTNMGTYAPREDIVEVVRPILAEFGFSLAFRTDWPEGKISIVGILTHEGGHSRESRFLTDADKSGSKNDVQARGSAVEYGRRYTTTDLLNIATRKADDDGTKAGRQLPEGFSEWMTEMHTAAMAGMKALTDKWQKSPKKFGDAMLAKEWELLKDGARKADKAAGRA